MAQLVIFGAGDIARLAHFYFGRDSQHQVVAFTVDRQYRRADAFLGLPLVDFENLAERYPPAEFQMFVGVGYARMNQVRAEKYGRAKEMGYQLASYISSHSTWMADQPAGDNCFILEDNTIQPYVQIGSDVTLWSGTHIGHDAIIGDHVFISSHAVISGHVTVGRNCFIGVNATLRDAITVAPYSLIGAGAVVMKDTVERGVYLPQRATLFDKKSDEMAL